MAATARHSDWRAADLRPDRDYHGQCRRPWPDRAELERRLLELGFVEGAEVEVLHEGPLGGDPIAVRLNHTRIALRRREAMAVFVS